MQLRYAVRGAAWVVIYLLFILGPFVRASRETASAAASDLPPR